MFDTMSVSERKRKQWTLALSFGAQIVMLGLAVLVPLLSTDGLPHRLAWVSVPEPPHALSHHAAPIHALAVEYDPHPREPSAITIASGNSFKGCAH